MNLFKEWNIKRATAGWNATRDARRKEIEKRIAQCKKDAVGLQREELLLRSDVRANKRDKHKEESFTARLELNKRALRKCEMELHNLDVINDSVTNNLDARKSLQVLEAEGKIAQALQKVGLSPKDVIEGAKNVAHSEKVREMAVEAKDLVNERVSTAEEQAREEDEKEEAKEGKNALSNMFDDEEHLILLDVLDERKGAGLLGPSTHEQRMAEERQRQDELQRQIDQLLNAPQTSKKKKKSKVPAPANTKSS